MNADMPSTVRSDNLKSIIAANISDLRRRHNMTQLELAERLNYTDKAISKWERGESIPDVLVLKQIADLFDVTVDYLLQEEHPASAETSEQEQVLTKKRQSIRARGFVTGMSILLVWLVATVLFMICDMAGADLIPHWIFFIYAIPASMILWLVLNSIWFNRRRNYLIISLLMWSVLISVFVTIWQVASYNAGLIFMLGIPGQAIVIMWSRLKQSGDK
jgi:transcriptional regulator with XRE-family HTH domain